MNSPTGRRSSTTGWGPETDGCVGISNGGRLETARLFLACCQLSRLLASGHTAVGKHARGPGQVGPVFNRPTRRPVPTASGLPYRDGDISCCWRARQSEGAPGSLQAGKCIGVAGPLLQVFEP